MEKIALITGASKGIGKALAEVFAKNGYTLLLVARNEMQLEQLQQTLQNKYQCIVKILSVDLSQSTCVDIIMQAFNPEISRLDVLVNNAGYGIAKKLTDIPEEDIQGMIAVNMTALTRLTYRILPHMVAKKSGRILNVASTAAYVPGPYMAIYYASKAYVLSLSEALYEEYKRDGVLVSALCPGVTKTEFQDRAGMNNTPIMSGALPIMSAETVAEMAYQGLARGKRVIVAGFMNKLTVFMMWLTPRFLAAKMTAWMDKPKKD